MTRRGNGVEEIEGPKEASLGMDVHLIKEQLETVHLIIKIVNDTGRCKE